MSTLPKGRFLFVIGVMLASALVILGHYAVLAGQGGTGRVGAQRATQNRGPIVDRNGRILAAEVRRYDIHVRPPRDRSRDIEVQRIAILATELAPILGMEMEEVFWRVYDADREIVLGRQVPAQAVDAIRGVQDRADGSLAGVTPRAVPFRVYPERNLAAQIVGFVGADHEGLEGVEFALNRDLSGRGASGRGSKVVLTIDANVQHILEQVAGSVLRETGAESVMFLAMDPRTGDILGSAVLPGFDPNDRGVSNPYLYRNLAALEHYEPGSVMKVFSVAALLEAGVISSETEFFCGGFYERVFPGGEVVRIACWNPHGHGRVRAREIVTLSCNVGAAYAAEMYSAYLFHRDLRNFGFGSSTGAWVNLETPGILAEPHLWSGRSRQTISFGQEIATSALQVMQAATVIANGGILVPPRIVSHVVSADGRTVTHRENPASSSRRVVSPRTAWTVLGYMRDTAIQGQGTGWRADMGDLSLAVKTGTSQILDPRGGYIASTLAILPAENPSLILYVVITRPQGETSSARIAAPAIRRAAEQLVDYLGIPRGRNPIFLHTGRLDIAEEVLPAVGPAVPNLHGFSKRALLPLLLRDDITVEIWGDGWVHRQSPPPGVALTRGMVLELELR
ncbi:MAG: penicillin-binding transpeptidase domain-containing protein [Treponema sp.]|nr:penicillin-binding transpeptidase domain-containing protein [Treponema sp.]